MTLPPDAALHGVPINYSWASGAANGQNQVPAKNNKGEWFTAMTSWGQVYIPVAGSQALNTRCQIRNLETKLLHKNGKWIVVQSDNPQGAAFVEDFVNNSSINADAREESNNGGGISIIVGVDQWAGHNFHFWPLGSRATVNIDSVTGVFTTCEARLIISDPNKPDDRSVCKNILQMGADWWLNLSIGWLPDWSANSGIGNGRSKWVTTEWQSFNYCSLSPAQILLNPPFADILNIEENAATKQIIIHPNPVHDKLSIVLPKTFRFTNASISVYDLKGLLIREQLFSEAISELSLESIKTGMYILKISNQDYKLVRKFIKE